MALNNDIGMILECHLLALQVQHSKKIVSLKSDRLAPSVTDHITLNKLYSLTFYFPIYEMEGLIPTWELSGLMN